MAKKTEDTKVQDAGTAAATQDANNPIESKEIRTALPQLFIRQVDRSPKDLLTLQSALVAAENIFYPNQQRLFDLYEEAKRDTHLMGIIKKRIDQVLNKTLLFKKNDEKVDAMDKLIRSGAMRGVITELIWRVMDGLFGLEFDIPGETSLKYNKVPKKHIKIKTQLITKEQTGLNEGIYYPDATNIWVLGDHHDFGLLLYASYYALLKRGAIGDWASYIELFGSPVIVLKYDGYNKDDKLAGENILKKSGNSQKLLIPRTMDWDMKDGKASNGDGKLQETFRLACNQEMSLIILGNTETSASGQHGSEGKSKTHSDQQKEIMKSDMEYILDCLNSDHFINILKAYGYPVEGGQFEYDKEVDVEYLTKFIPVITQLATQVGLAVSKKQLYDLTGLAEPEDADDTIQLFPVLGQQPTIIDPDEQDGQPPATTPRPKPKTPQALSLSDVSAMMDEKLKTFFGQAF